MKKIIINILMILMILFAISFSSFAEGNFNENNIEETTIVFEKAKVLKCEDLRSVGDYQYDYQLVTVSIETGDYKGEVVEIENVLPENIAYRIIAEEGKEVIIGIEGEGESRQIYVSDYSRNSTTKVLVLVFLALLVIVGKQKGIKSVITISLTMFLIFKVLLPGILNGKDPLMLAIIIASLITVLTIIIVSGFNKKSYAAIMGTIIGVVVAAIIAMIVGNVITITGLMPDEAAMLTYIPQGISLNYNNLLFAGILLGALGAVMDVAMSIASSIQEIYLADKSQSRRKLFSSGMAIGHDIMGTMSNTLILAYTGSSIPLLLILMSYQTPLSEITNMDIVATEIVRSLAGSIGLIITIPVTAFLSVILLEIDNKKKPV